MMIFEFIVGITLGAVDGGVIKMTNNGGGAIVGRDNVRNAINKEKKIVRGRFDDLKVTKDDPKFYE